MATKSIDISKLSKIAVTRDSRYQVLSTTGVHCSVAPTGKILIDFYIDLPPLIVDSEEGGDLQIAANRSGFTSLDQSTAKLRWTVLLVMPPI